MPSVRSLHRFLAEAQSAVRLRGAVTVLLTSDAAIRGLNRRFRGKNKPTDVLSFPAAEIARDDHKGDLALSVETAYRQSVEHGHSLGSELKVLILHGLLHLAGYDHETDAGRMERREQLLRKRLGLPQGLIERTAPTGISRHRNDAAARSVYRRAKDDATKGTPKISRKKADKRSRIR